MIDGTDSEERSLVERCLAGEKHAWDEFFSAHYRTIASVVGSRRWGFDRSEVEDVIQDVLEAVIKSLKRFEFRSRVNTFVYKISVSTCIARLRKKTAVKRGGGSAEVHLDLSNTRLESDTVQDHAGCTGNPEELLLRQENIFTVGQALAKLGERCKELVRYRYFNELSFQEIAARTGLKENSLVVQMKRCLLRLFGYLQAGGGHV